MNSKFFVPILLVLAFILGSCSTVTTSARKDYEYFEEGNFKILEVHRDSPFLTYILLDEETGVEYLALYLKNGNVTITPRYNSDGNLYVKQGGY